MAVALERQQIGSLEVELEGEHAKAAGRDLRNLDQRTGLPQLTGRRRGLGILLIFEVEPVQNPRIGICVRLQPLNEVRAYLWPLAGARGSGKDRAQDAQTATMVEGLHQGGDGPGVGTTWWHVAAPPEQAVYPPRLLRSLAASKQGRGLRIQEQAYLAMAP